MKRILLNTTALIGAGAVTSAMGGYAQASDGIKLEVGGFFRTAYMVNIDDNDAAHGTHPADLGHDRATDGVFSDAEIYFKGEVTLDNGLKVGARVELEGETAGDQIDEAYVYFSGGFGKFEIGSDDEALRQSCVTPPGGTTNFGAFSPNQWASNDSIPFVVNSNEICTGVDDKSDSQKLVYFTPNFSGFQLVVSYTPNSNKETQVDGVGPHVGMPTEDVNASRHNFSAYATYQYKGDGWGVQWGGGGSWEGHVEDGNDAAGHRNASDFYQTGLNVSIGDFKIGGAFEFLNDFATVSATDRGRDAWIAGGGVSYKVDAWTVGAQYSHGNFDTVTEDISDDKLDRVALTGRYDMGPGISLDGEIAYTWQSSEESVARDDYDSIEFGLGTAFNF